MIQHIGSYFFTYTFIVETYCSLKIYIKVCLLGATKGIEAVSIINTESIQTLVRLCWPRNTLSCRECLTIQVNHIIYHFFPLYVQCGDLLLIKDLYQDLSLVGYKRDRDSISNINTKIIQALVRHADLETHWLAEGTKLFKLSTKWIFSPYVVEIYCLSKIYIKVCLLGATKGIEAVSIINTQLRAFKPSWVRADLDTHCLAECA